MAKKIFLIEDEEGDYNLIKAGLKEYQIIPDQYKNGFEVVKAYLNDNSEINKEKIVDFIIVNQINLIILDIKLWEENNGGIFLYDRVFSQDKRIMEIPVIYLTSTTLQSEVTLNKFTAYVQKRYSSRGFDVESAISRIKDEIAKFCYSESVGSQWLVDNL